MAEYDGRFSLQNYTRRFFFRITRDVFFRDDAMVMAKGDGREVGDRERTGSSWVFISCSWYTREQLT